jgi:lambda family phage portal protein
MKVKLLDSLANRFGYIRKPAKKTEKRFKAAGNTRLLADWTVQRSAINKLIQSGLVAVRARTRELCRDDAYMKGYIGLCNRNIVGADGVKIELNVTEDDGRQDKRAQDKIKAAWMKFCRRGNFSVTRNMSFFDFQKLIITTTPQAGEFLIRTVKGFDNDFGFAIQVLEPDCLDEQLNRDNVGNGNFIRMGVEFNQWKEPVAYHIRIRNPYDDSYGQRTDKTERLPADEIIHGFIPLDINQVRGFPWPHAAMILSQMVDGYQEAALVHARSAACQMGFIEHTLDSGGPMKTDDAEIGDDGEPTGNSIIEQEPGIIRELDPGQKFAKWDPAHPNAEHSQFMKSGLRAIATALWCSYNSLGNDLEGVNYSSIRAGLLDERDSWKMFQRWFNESLYEIIFERWLLMAITTGEVELPMYKFDKFNQPAFIARRWPWVDPEKDIKAAIEEINNGLGTRTDKIAEAGGSIDEVFSTLQSEIELAKASGLTFGDGARNKALEDLSSEMTAYGVAVRAGTITPTVQDEEYFRAKAGFPPLSSEARTAWGKEKNVRRPITIQPIEGPKAPGGQSSGDSEPKEE